MSANGNMKQQATVLALAQAILTVRGFSPTFELKDDATTGKVLVSVTGGTMPDKSVAKIDNWPVIAIGRNGGIDLPSIRSYANPAFDAAVIADKHLARQNGYRSALLATTPALPVAVTVGNAPGVTAPATIPAKK